MIPGKNKISTKDYDEAALTQWVKLGWIKWA